MPRPIQAQIHTAALAHNLARARAAAPGARVFAVVKANAYGHGLERVYAGLNGADGFALLDLGEAERLRTLGWRGPILLLEGCFEPRDLETCSRLHLWHTVHDAAQIEMLAAHKTHASHHVFLKMNSGMNRLGFTPETLRAAWLRLSGLTQVGDITVMTHFAEADAGIDHALAPATQRQLTTFDAACADLGADRSLCNSAATLRYAHERPELCGDWIRPGIMLYGSSPDFPSTSSANWELQPAMTLSARIIAVQQLRRGDSVGYGGCYTAERPMRIGVVACGYADGYPRAAACGNTGGAPVLVEGMRSRIVGRVSMDMITVDLGAVPAADLGSEVTLWGRGPGGTVLSIDEVAQAAGTIGYELMCGLAARVPTRAD